MKRFVVAMLLLALALPALAKDKKPAKAAPGGDQKTTLLNMEKSLWEAFKNNDTKPFEAALTTDMVDLSGPAPVSRADFFNMLNSKACTVNSYAIDDSSAQIVAVDKDCVVLYYKVTEDASCNGQKAPPAQWASSVWVKQGGKWKAAFHQESPAPSAAAAATGTE